MKDRSFWKEVNAGKLELTHLFTLFRAAEDAMDTQTRLIELLEKDGLPILAATEGLITNCLIYRQLMVVMLMKLRQSRKHA